MKRRGLSVKKRCLVLSTAAVMALGCYGLPMGVFAAQETVTTVNQNGTIAMSTDYPGISSKPGNTVNFKLALSNGTEDSEDLELAASLPDGWGGYFRGSDGEVSTVHAEAGLLKADSPSLTYSLTIPEDAEDGVYDITLTGTGAKVSTEMHLKVAVTHDEAGESSFTTQYPEQQGASGASFSFDTTLINNSATDQSFSLSSNAEEGWNVSFTPSGESNAVASLPIDAGATQGITVAINPPATIEKGDYVITLTAISAEQTLTLDLTVSITGTYSVQLSTSTGNLSASAYAGETTWVAMAVTNTGNVALENLSLAGQASTDWTVSFDEDTIETLEAGETRTINASITPAKDAIIGDYVVAITAKNKQVTAESDLRVSVKNHTTWGLIAVGVIVILVAGLGLVIRKYGRR